MNTEEIQREIDNNSMYEWSTFDVYQEAYDKGYNDGLEETPSDEMLLKIIHFLDKGMYLFSEMDDSSYSELVEYLKNKLNKKV